MKLKNLCKYLTCKGFYILAERAGFEPAVGY